MTRVSRFGQVKFTEIDMERCAMCVRNVQVAEAKVTNQRRRRKNIPSWPWPLITVLIVSVTIQWNCVQANVLPAPDKLLPPAAAIQGEQAAVAVSNNNSTVLVETTTTESATTTIEEEEDDQQEEEKAVTSWNVARDRSHIYKNLRLKHGSMPETCENYEVSRN